MSLISRLRNAIRPSRLDDEIDEELRFHVAARTEDLITEGLPPDEAAREARRRFGHALPLHEESRDIRLLPRLESLVQDVRFGARILAKHPVVTAAAVLSLGLAAGASIAAFSLIDALIMRPLPVRDPQRLVYLTIRNVEAGANEVDSFSYILFQRLRESARPNAELFGASYPWPHAAIVDRTQSEHERVSTQWISGRAFGVLGITPALGRVLNADDDRNPGQSPVAVLAHRFWVRRFGTDPKVIGRWISIDGKEYQVVGVARQGFDTLEPGVATDCWVPLTMGHTDALANPGWSWFRIWGRLDPTESPDRLQQRLQPTFGAFRKERSATFPPDIPLQRLRGYLATPLFVNAAANGPSSIRLQFERPLWIMSGLVALVLLIACTNVANLQIARATAREREMALRVSIGAGRGRIVQQVIVESALLTVGAVVFGLLFAALTVPAIVSRLMPSDAPTWLDVRWNWGTLVFLIGLSAASTLLCGLFPALRTSVVAPQTALKSTGGRNTTPLRALRPLIAAQLSFSVVVLFVTALLLGSFVRLVTIDPGFTSRDVTLLTLSAPPMKTADGQRDDADGIRTVRERILAAVRDRSGVTSASLSGWALFAGSSWSSIVRVPGRAPGATEPSFLEVSPNFFETMRIPLLGGRDFTGADAAPEHPSAAVVNEAFARQYFGRLDVVGRTFQRFERQGTVPHEIVGVVGNAKYNDLREPAPPTVYVPIRTLDGLTIQVRSDRDAVAVASLVKAELARIHSDLHVTGVSLQSSLIANNLIRERLLALLSAFFGIVALLLAVIGLYGVLSYAVVQRTREIGIRMALGARPGGVVRLVFAEAAIATGIGLLVGLGVGLLAARVVATLLYEVTPADPFTAALTITVLGLAAVLAGLPPALRATHVDPVIALRYE